MIRRLWPQLHPLHPCEGVVHRVTADTKVLNRLLDVAGEKLLPGFTIRDLITVREAVPKAVDPARQPPAVDHTPRAVHCAGEWRIVVVEAAAAVDRPRAPRIDERPAAQSVVYPAVPHPLRCPLCRAEVGNSLSRRLHRLQVSHGCRLHEQVECRPARTWTSLQLAAPHCRNLSYPSVALMTAPGPVVAAGAEPG